MQNYEQSLKHQSMVFLDLDVVVCSTRQFITSLNMFCPGNQSRLKIGKLARFRKYDLLIFDFTKIIYLFLLIANIEVSAPSRGPDKKFEEYFYKNVSQDLCYFKNF